MGHTRLAYVPTTQKWKDLVAIVVGGSPDESVSDFSFEITRIAGETLGTAERAIEVAKEDAGVAHAFYLLTQIVLSGRRADFRQFLSQLEIHVSENCSRFDLISGLNQAIDKFLSETGRRTDISEMAQKAAGEALIESISAIPRDLFAPAPDNVREDLRKLSTKARFADLTQRFFGAFVSRFLNFYLSRIVSTSLGRSDIAQIGDLTRFNSLLRTHCEQSALIVHDFAGEWFSKANFRTGINKNNSSRFVTHAITKLKGQIKRQGGDD